VKTYRGEERQLQRNWIIGREEEGRVINSICRKLLWGGKPRC
jgi:hypothetical protein